MSNYYAYDTAPCIALCCCEQFQKLMGKRLTTLLKFYRCTVILHYGKNRKTLLRRKLRCSLAAQGTALRKTETIRPQCLRCCLLLRLHEKQNENDEFLACKSPQYHFTSSEFRTMETFLNTTKQYFRPLHHHVVAANNKNRSKNNRFCTSSKMKEDHYQQNDFIRLTISNTTV